MTLFFQEKSARPPLDIWLEHLQETALEISCLISIQFLLSLITESVGNCTVGLGLIFYSFSIDFNKRIYRKLCWRPQAQFLFISYGFESRNLQETALEVSGSISIHFLLILIGESTRNCTGGLGLKFYSFSIDFNEGLMLPLGLVQ